MFPGLNLAQWLTLHGLVTLLAVLFYVITSHLMHQRRHPSAAIAWILFILLMPYVALPIFLTFGSRKLARPRAMLQLQPALGNDALPWAVQTLQALGQPAPDAYRELDIHVDGHAATLALWRVIDAAQQSIDVCTFILGRDRLGVAVIDRLCVKAAAGVRVRVLLDGLGSLMAGRPDLRRLRAAGALCTLFVPPLHSPLKGRTNLRNHRKLLITDGALETRRLWCGGRNLASAYFEGEPGRPPWIDLSFDLCGPVVRQATALFEHDWAFAGGAATAGVATPPAFNHAHRAAPTHKADGAVMGGAAPNGAASHDTAKRDTAARDTTTLDTTTLDTAKLGTEKRDAASATALAQLVASGPDQVDDTLYALLVSAAFRARRRISLASPYFVPDGALTMALALAARRGVVVDLLLPARSNHPLSDFARSRALRVLSAAGVRVWLTTQMLHAKLVVVDDSLALAGSANLDSRSLFLNYELMLAFHEPADVERFASWFGPQRLSAHRYAARRPGLLRDMLEGMILWLGFQL